MEPTYDPFQFISKTQLITIAIIGSFITIKFLNALYENLYEPIVDVIIESKQCDNYYIKIGEYHIQIGTIIKEFIKWFLLIIVLMLAYNIIIHKKIEKITY